MKPTYRKLVVGGGRQPDFPKPKSGDLTLNVRENVRPHVAGTIFRAPFKSASFDHILFERFSWQDILDNRPSGIEVAHRLLRPGGTLVILTGIAPLGTLIPEIESNGFLIDVLQVEAVTKTGMKVFCHGMWLAPGGVYLRAVKNG